jgi:hypothetical protein
MQKTKKIITQYSLEPPLSTVLMETTNFVLETKEANLGFFCPGNPYLEDNDMDFADDMPDMTEDDSIPEVPLLLFSSTESCSRCEHLSQEQHCTLIYCVDQQNVAKYENLRERATALYGMNESLFGSTN